MATYYANIKSGKSRKTFKGNNSNTLIGIAMDYCQKFTGGSNIRVSKKVGKRKKLIHNLWG